MLLVVEGRVTGEKAYSVTRTSISFERSHYELLYVFNLTDAGQARALSLLI
jgi:hypothetical protein